MADSEEEGIAEVRRVERFRSTVLRAALDAALGRFWDAEACGYVEPRRFTQVRRLGRAIGWLGLAGDLSVDERHRRATSLGIETFVLSEASGSLDRWRDRGEAVVRVLEHLSEGACLLDRLLEAGFLAGLWGRPFQWDPATGRLREVVFRTTGPLPGESPV